MSEDLAVDMFAGPGGFDTGLRDAGFDGEILGIDSSVPACQTAQKAGHFRFCESLGSNGFAPSRIARPVHYLHGSPPCGGFTLNGKGRGRLDGEALLRCLRSITESENVPSRIDDWSLVFQDPRTELSLEPLRWIYHHRPRYVSLEQVSWALRLWEEYARILRGWGYAVATGYVQAEAYGIPQTRKRAILVADLEAATVALPAPTHSRYHNHRSDYLDPGVVQWISLATAIPALGDPAEVERRLNNQTQQVWDLSWPHRRPSLAITGMDKIPMPGDFNKRSRNDGIRIVLEEAALLQSFPDDYPWQGTPGEKRQQVGDAVPPRLARAIVEGLMR